MAKNGPDAMATIADELLTAAELVRGQELMTVRAEVSAAQACAQLDEVGFDVAPITSVPIRQFVRRDELAGAKDELVGAFARDISDAERLPESTPLSETLRALKRQPYLFVQHRQHVTGLITHADIGQQPVNLLVLGTILSFESALDALIQGEAPEEEWFKVLSESRQEAVESIFRQRQQANIELGRINCLSVSDRIDIARKLHLSDRLGFSSARELKTWKEQVRDLRDTLAHGGTVLDAFPEPDDALAGIEQLSHVAARSWASSFRG